MLLGAPRSRTGSSRIARISAPLPPTRMHSRKRAEVRSSSRGRGMSQADIEAEIQMLRHDFGPVWRTMWEVIGDGI